MGKICKNTWYKCFANISFSLLPSSRFNLHIFFRLFCQTTFIEMHSLNRYEEVTCENCDTQTTKLNLKRHKKSCSAGTLYCTQCPNFSTKSQNDLNYHIAKKHSAPKLDVTFKCKLCYQEFPRFYALRQHRNTQHGMQFGSGTRDVGVEHIVGDVEDHSLRRVAFLSTFLCGFRTWKGETQSIRLRSGNSQRNNRERETWSFFQQFEMCSKSESGFWLEKHRRWRIQILLRTRKQCPAGSIQACVHHDDLAKLKGFFNITDVIESCSRERMNTMWRFYKLTNLTVFAALLQDVPMGCKDAVLPEPLLRNATINCLKYEENTRQPYNDNLCLFRARAPFARKSTSGRRNI